MNDRRSIQDIIPPARSKPLRPSITPPVPPSMQQMPPVPPPPRPPEEHYDMSGDYNDEPRRGYWTFIAIGVGAIVLVAGVVGLMSTVFHTAHASVVVSEWKSDISGTYSAGGNTPLTYQPVTITDTATKSVPAAGTTQANDHAFGTIVISNLFSPTAQRLITNTRFQTASGLIYRIHAPVVVPGYIISNGVKTAGVIEAVAYADEAGEKYNIGMTTFTIPGLKGSQQYSTMTAKSKTAMTGGFVGMRATVEQSVRDQTIQDLHAQLDRSLRDKIAGQAPAASVIFSDSIDVSYTEQPDKADGNNAIITVNGSATAPAFAEDSLVRALATHAGVTADAPLTLANPTELTYSAGPGGDVASGGAISFTLGGMAHLVAAFNPTQLAQDLAGKTEAQVDTVRAGYPALVGPISIKVYPFWIHTLPTSPGKITVTVTGALDQSH